MAFNKNCLLLTPCFLCYLCLTHFSTQTYSSHAGNFMVPTRSHANGVCCKQFQIFKFLAFDPIVLLVIETPSLSSSQNALSMIIAFANSSMTISDGPIWGHHAMPMTRAVQCSGCQKIVPKSLAQLGMLCNAAESQKADRPNFFAWLTFYVVA